MKKKNKKLKLKRKIKQCKDPVVRGRLRGTSLEHMAMGTSWAIRKKKIPKSELEILRKKYEPTRYGIKIEAPVISTKRRPKSEI